MTQTGGRKSASLDHLHYQQMLPFILPTAPEEATIGAMPIKARSIQTVMNRCWSKSIEIKSDCLLSIALKCERITKSSVNSNAPATTRVWADNLNQRTNTIPTGYA
jgi:hypothetical protein